MMDLRELLSDLREPFSEGVVSVQEGARKRFIALAKTELSKRPVKVFAKDKPGEWYGYTMHFQWVIPQKQWAMRGGSANKEGFLKEIIGILQRLGLKQQKKLTRISQKKWVAEFAKSRPPLHASLAARETGKDDLVVTVTFR